ncbi:MAG: cytochrome C [Thiobacillus sp. 63-78]|uniref:c-type cytochrome n=1 Tax=Thiobacillus sp. 63-78 TaxID=1895859 RepID=UPI0009624A0A|nr:cytochrome c [Thiobacillus sp. 63-78]MBN8763369.1 cytochrome c [Thiobacillus sp.]MBN8774571.1 cytochrome c [Thiobacillus sp.]OJZ12415.1 MAG: cytochrome C [Thiobacillus sp. 63-78]
MKTTLLILATAALAASLPVLASGNYEAGKAKSTTCAACHGFDGNSTVSSFPKLAGQHRDYLLQALHEYKIGVRKNPIMGGQVQALSDADMQDLATYFSEQKGLTLKY